MRNELEISRLSSEDLLSVLTCQASNTASVPPLEASILIDITSECILLPLVLLHVLFPELTADPVMLLLTFSRNPIKHSRYEGGYCVILTLETDIHRFIERIGSH